MSNMPFARERGLGCPHPTPPDPRGGAREEVSGRFARHRPGRSAAAAGGRWKKSREGERGASAQRGTRKALLAIDPVRGGREGGRERRRRRHR